jgi:hypothetical protein
LTGDQIMSLLGETRELVAILTTIVKKTSRGLRTESEKAE